MAGRRIVIEHHDLIPEAQRYIYIAEDRNQTRRRSTILVFLCQFHLETSLCANIPCRSHHEVAATIIRAAAYIMHRVSQPTCFYSSADRFVTFD